MRRIFFIDSRIYTDKEMDERGREIRKDEIASASATKIGGCLAMTRKKRTRKDIVHGTEVPTPNFYIWSEALIPNFCI